MAIPRVFTIPASAPFVPTLLRALLDGTLVPGFPAARDPLALAGATLYLPTRRACRLARDLFLDVTAETAAILPRIGAIGDLDEDEIAFAQAATGALAADALELPPTLGPLERRMLLARLVLTWAGRIAPDKKGEAALVANNPASALALADELARLMDDMTTRGVAWERLDELVPENLDRYWQLTLEFLQIAREAWPKILAERGRIEPAARRDALIKAEAARLAAHTDGPVIAAGSTGSMPATAALIATIARLPHGAVVLPGLDTDLDAESWELIAGKQDAAGREVVPPAVGHPQFAMQALLRRIGIARDAVIALAEPARHGRERYVSEALRPAVATDRWRGLATSDFPAQVEGALEQLTVIEAANAEEEALAIAVALRGPRPRPGTAGLARALATFRAELAKLRRKEPSDLHPSDPRTLLTDAELDAAGELVVRLTTALAPLEALRAPRPFADIAACHRDVIAALSAEPPDKTAIFGGPDGVALATAFDEIALDQAGLVVAPANYAELFRTVISDRVVRRPGLPGVRVRIYGLLEARLQSVDRMVLGGLVEGTWPPDAGSDPWLNRPMRHTLGLDLPERRISLSAHDFAQALGATEVILTYPAKLAGAPTVTSRFVQRLAAVAGEERWSGACRRGEQYLHWARALDRPMDVQHVKKPAPKPPREARPSALSVTDIEN